MEDNQKIILVLANFKHTHMKRIIYITSILSILHTGIGWAKDFSVSEQISLHHAQIKTLANTPDDDRFQNNIAQKNKKATARRAAFFIQAC